MSCIICKKKYDNSFFIRNDKVFKVCNNCASYQKEYREKNKEKIKNLKKEYREKNKTIISEKNKAHYKNNKDYFKKCFKLYYQENKEKIKEYKKLKAKKIQQQNKKYYKNHKDYFKNYNFNHKVETFLSRHSELKPYKEQLKSLEKIKACPICGHAFSNLRFFSFDHIIPKLEKIENIHVICSRCNVVKNNLTLEELKLLSEDNLCLEKNNKNKEEILKELEITEKRFNQIYLNKKARAKYKGIDFLISKEDLAIIMVSTCPILKIKLYYNGGIGSGKDNLFSIDRIDSQKGYIPGNCRIISYKANRAKNNANIVEIKKIYSYLRYIISQRF